MSSQNNKGASIRPNKRWSLKPVEGNAIFHFYPVWHVRKEAEKGLEEMEGSTEADIECRWIDIEVEKDGKTERVRFNYLDLYMFLYFTANEELRKNLAMRYERKVNYIPYDVTFKISPEEKEAGLAKRRIQLPVDEIAMAIARNDAFGMLMSKSKGGHLPNPNDFKYKPKKGM